MTFVQRPDRSKEAGMSMSIQNTLIEEASSGQGCKGLMYMCVCAHTHSHEHTRAYTVGQGSSSEWSTEHREGRVE